LASRHPHLSVVQIVKELLSRRAVSLNPSAAERRDYEELPSNRQAILQDFLLTTSFEPLKTKTLGKTKRL
jgi:hypothetical protein